MSQVRIFAKTDAVTARTLMEPVELLFEGEGLPVSAFESPENPGEWFISVYANTEIADDVNTSVARLIKDQGLALDLEREDIPDQDWVAATLRELSPVTAGRFIVHGSHDQTMPKAHQIAIRIDAGLAFGTGHHGTTAGCLEMMSLIAKYRQFSNILDLGSGSGVLAIAAAKTWNADVLASDIDPVATRTAANNICINGVAGRIRCITSAGLSNRTFGEHAKFDLVVANILARPLQAMALDIALHTTPNGKIILSGLLPHQQALIVATFRIHGCVFERAYIRDGWLTLLLRKA